MRVSNENFTPKCLLCQSPVKPIKLSDFGPIFGPPLGSGAYGTVRKHKSDRYGAVAIKTVIPPANKPIVELEPSVIREIAALVALFPHPNIIGIHGFDLAANGTASIVLECGLMSLADAMKQSKVGGDNAVSRSVMGQIFRATQYMHQQDIWHRDIKPANVIVTALSPIHVKLADFGLSRSGPFCGVTPTQVMYTLWYRPPEILINEVLSRDKTVSVYDDSAEMWALGIVYWELLTANTIQDKNITKILRSTTDATPIKQLLAIYRVFGFTATQQPLKDELAKRYWPFGSVANANTDIMQSVMSPQTWSVLSRMLNTDAQQRITLTELLGQQTTSKSTFEELKEKEVMTLSRTCIAGLPGNNYQEQLLSYTRTAYKMLKFIVDNKMSKDLATYFIAMQAFGCVISSAGARAEASSIEIKGMLCAHLAGKYYSRHRPDMEDVLLALHSSKIAAIADTSELTRAEIAVFNQLNGEMHRPNCFRFMVEMFEGCSEVHPNLFAWSYCIMCTIVMTKAAFVGKPSDIAKLAIQIAAHYLQQDVAKTIPTATMTIQELIQGAKLGHGTLITLPLTERNAIIELVMSILKDTLGPSSVVNSDQFMSVLKGNLLYTAKNRSEKGDENSEEDQPAQKRKRELDQRNEDFELSV